MSDTISFKEHQQHMEEFKVYQEFLEKQTEFEEAVEHLLSFPNVYYLGQDFEQAYYKAVRDNLNWFKENAVIIEEPEKEVTVMQPAQRYMEYEDEY